MKKEQILAECIAEVKGGNSTVEDCVARHPEFGRELRPLLEIALGLSPTVEAASPEFKARARAAVQRAMQGNELTVERGRMRRLQPVLSLKAATVAIGVLAAVVVAGAGTVFASQRTVPGDALYPVKTGVESVQLALTPGHEAKASLHLKLAERRVDEAAREAKTEHGPSAALPTSVGHQLDAAIGEIGKADPQKVKSFMRQLEDSTLRGELTVAGVASGKSSPVLSETTAVLQRGRLIAEVSYDNPAFMGTSPSVLDNSLEAGRFEVVGTLTGADSHSWKIDGMALGNVDYSGTPPPVDSPVKAEGIIRDGKTFITSVQSEDNASDEVTIEGVVKGSDGSVTVGGIPVTVASGPSLPQAGNKARLSGTAKDGKVNVSRVESKQTEDIGVEFEGTLTSVDLSGQTILAKRAGTQVKVNVSQAQTGTQDGQSLTLAQLQSAIGQGVQIDGLRQQNGILYAKQLLVDTHGKDSGPHSR